jgi:protein ImuA
LDLPEGVAATLWRGDQFGTPSGAVTSSGFEQLDQELPGGGWPVGSVTELLQPQYSLAEVQLLLPAVVALAGTQRQVLVIGAQNQPFLPGWQEYGIRPEHVLVVRPHTPAQALWVTEQAVRANGIGAVLAWLPHARPEQVRRLQACAGGSDFPVFLMRPQEADLQSSAAPLRVQARLVGLGQIGVRILKRRGPTHERELVLATASRSLAPLLWRRSPSRLDEVPRAAALDRADSRAWLPQSVHAVGR